MEHFGSNTRKYIGPVTDAVQLLIVQPTPFCNINCDYCYLPDRASTGRLPPETFCKLLQQIFESGLVKESLSIAWHAGEPLVVPILHYKTLFNVIDQLSIPRARIRHSIQTNGTLISDAWCDLFIEHQINLGVSLDGPARLHDLHRRDRQGRGTHERVIEGINCLRKHDIDFHVIAVVTSDALNCADEIFDFFLELQVRRLGFNIEELEGQHSSSSIKDAKTETNLRRFWERLYTRQQHSGGQIEIREFERASQVILHGPPRINALESMRHSSQISPFGIISMDWRGNISSFSPELLGLKSLRYGDFNFGNVHTCDFHDIRVSPKFNQVANDIYAGVDLCEHTCEYFSLCGGGAPSNKYFENGSFISTETMYCRASIQAPIDVVLADLENQLKLTTL